MATANESPGAAEAPAQIASAQELRQIAQDTFGLHIQTKAPALPLASHLLTGPRGPAEDSGVVSQKAEFPAAALTPEAGSCLPAAAPGYKACFYDREYGDLTDVVTTASFDTGVQLVRDRLPVKADYVVEATWTRGIGEMEVRSPNGNVVARVESAAQPEIAVQPPITKACTALQVGDAEPMERLFAPLPEAA